MKCNMKTMLTIALALALVLAVGYWALPEFRGSLTTFILVACSLACPLSMLFMHARHAVWCLQAGRAG